MKHRTYIFILFVCSIFFVGIYLYISQQQKTSFSEISQVAVYTGDEDREFFGTGVQFSTDPVSMAERYITKLYQTKDPQYIVQVINFYLQAHQYEKALGFLELLQQQGDATKNIPVELLMTTLFNGLELNFKNLDMLKRLIQTYYTQTLITTDQFLIYDALITFSRGDYNNYSYFMDQITDPTYISRKTSFQALQKQFYSFPDASSEYFEALIAMDVFKKGYPNIAKTRAKILLAKNDSYLLPKQILLYGDFLQENWTGTLMYLEKITLQDPDNVELYHFMKGVSSVSLGKYQEALFAFQQLPSQSIYIPTTQKYKLFLYSTLQDRTTLSTLTKEILKQPLSVAEYIGIFDVLLYKYPENSAIVSMQRQEVVAELLRKCYSELTPDESFACLYGKTGVIVGQGDIEQSYQALRQLVSLYPQDYLYERLAILAEQKGDTVQANKFHFRAMSMQPQKKSSK